MDDIELVVLSHFDGYVRGDVISDKIKIDEILTGPHQYDVIKRKSASGIAAVHMTPASAVNIKD